MSESTSWWSALLDWLTRLWHGTPPEQGDLAPLRPRVLMITFNPTVDARGTTLIHARRWNDPARLAADYIADVRECSGGLVDYQIVQHIQADLFPVKQDGFYYTPREYIAVVNHQQPAHAPDAVDYDLILAQFDILARVANNEIDEVWLFGGPYFGFWEATMGGVGAFFCNGEPLAHTAASPRRFIVMGFSYERGVGEMLENLGHRAEAILARVFRSEDFLQWAYKHARTPPTVSGVALNLYERFLCFDQIAPGKANVGTIHYAPNSPIDYAWGVMTPVLSCADDWLHFPNLPTPPNYRPLDARAWGGGDMRAHHKWWLAHLPRAAGVTNGIANHWWKYFIDVNQPIFR